MYYCHHYYTAIGEKALSELSGIESEACVSHKLPNDSRWVSVSFLCLLKNADRILCCYETQKRNSISVISEKYELFCWFCYFSSSSSVLFPCIWVFKLKLIYRKWDWKSSFPVTLAIFTGSEPHLGDGLGSTALPCTAPSCARGTLLPGFLPSCGPGRKI